MRNFLWNFSWLRKYNYFEKRIINGIKKNVKKNWYIIEKFFMKENLLKEKKVEMINIIG